jgi:hypothetical protein
MPFKSQAQRRKFAQLLVEHKISPQTFEEWNRETGGKKLPTMSPNPAPTTRLSLGGSVERNRDSSDS